MRFNVAVQGFLDGLAGVLVGNVGVEAGHVQRGQDAVGWGEFVYRA